MIRRPSTISQIYAWHRAALSGNALPIHDGIAEAGWYKRKLVKGGPWVPVCISVVREIDPATGELLGPEMLVADVDGRREDPARHWTYLTPISRAEYEALIYRQSLIPAMANTTDKVDLTQEPLPWTN